MTSIERVRTTLRFEEPDKVPLATYVIDCDIIEKVIGRKTLIRDKAGQQIAFWEGRRDEVAASMIDDLVDLFNALDIFDVIALRKMAHVPAKGHHPEGPREIGEGLWENKNGVRYKYSALTNEIATDGHKTNWDQQFNIEDYSLDPEVGPEDESIYEVYDAVLPRMPKDKYILGPFPAAAAQVLLGGYERGLVEVALNPELVGRAVQSSIARARKQQALYRDRTGHGVLTEGDFGHSTGTFVSPATFRALFLPGMAANGEAIRARGLEWFHHSCGDNKPIMDQFVEVGLDCLQSLQPQAGMVPGYVKQVTGNRVAAWGGVDVATLVAGSPDDVRRDVREAMDTAKRGGGFILGSSHSIAYGTSYDNFMAMLDEFEKTREY